jgi:hypothetical protein
VWLWKTPWIAAGEMPLNTIHNSTASGARTRDLPGLKYSLLVLKSFTRDVSRKNKVILSIQSNVELG